MKVRMPPPKLLNNKKLKDTWKQVVGAYSSEHFNAGDVPLLINYVRASVKADESWEMLQQEGDSIFNPKTGNVVLNPTFTIWKNTVASLATLAQKLRICPSSRVRPEESTQSNRKAKDGQVYNPTADWRDFQELN